MAMALGYGFGFPVSAQESVPALEARAAEQERQIRQLELQNLRLQEQIDRLTERLEAADRSSSPSEATPGPQPQSVSPSQLAAVRDEATTLEGKPDSVSAVVHTVEPGDTLYGIARNYRVSPKALIELNQITDPGRIRLGQSLKIPASNGSTAKAAPAQSAAARHHVVETGESFYSISTRYGVAMAELQRLNPDIEPRSLQVGQKLLLPQDSARSNPRRNHSEESPIRSADRPQSFLRTVPVTEKITVRDFARQHQIDLSNLNALNGLDLDERTFLAKGTELYVRAHP